MGDSVVYVCTITDTVHHVSFRFKGKGRKTKATSVFVIPTTILVSASGHPLVIVISFFFFKIPKSPKETQVKRNERIHVVATNPKGSTVFFFCFVCACTSITFFLF